MAVVALVLAAVAPPVGLVLGWVALRETHPVTGTKGGRDLAVAALWVNGAVTALVLLLVGAVLLQVLGSLLMVLPLVASSGA